MSCPSLKSIGRGIGFVCVGLVKAMCDRWLEKTCVQGKPTRKHHHFDHMFLLWFLKQVLQLCLLFIHKAIQNNWLGCGRCKHGEPEPRQLNQHIEDGPLRNLVGDNDEDCDQDGILHGGIRDEDGDDERPNQPRRNRRKKPSWLIYLPPAVFAQASTLLLFFGLNLTYSSSFMMLKGTVALFTALLSMAFLAQQLACYVWFGVVVATIGFALSGIADYVHVPSRGYEKYGIAAGDLLIVMAQIMFATKIIYEEKFIRKHSIHPLVFLGSEAAFGVVLAAILLIISNLVDAIQYSTLPNGRLEDIQDAFYQLQNSWVVIVAMCGALISYIMYTYLGLFLIREHSALHRIMIETFIWLFYWVICLALGWEHFFISQVPGLCVIAIGSLIYSHILLIPFVSRTNDDLANVNYGHLGGNINLNGPAQDGNRNRNLGFNDDDEILDGAVGGLNNEEDQERHDEENCIEIDDDVTLLQP